MNPAQAKVAAAIKAADVVMTVKESTMPPFDYQTTATSSHSATFSDGEKAKEDAREREKLRAVLQNLAIRACDDAELRRRQAIFEHDGTWRPEWGPPPSQAQGGQS